MTSDVFFNEDDNDFAPESDYIDGDYDKRTEVLYYRLREGRIYGCFR